MLHSGYQPGSKASELDQAINSLNAELDHDINDVQKREPPVFSSTIDAERYLEQRETDYENCMNYIAKLNKIASMISATFTRKDDTQQSYVHQFEELYKRLFEYGKLIGTGEETLEQIKVAPEVLVLEDVIKPEPSTYMSMLIEQRIGELTALLNQSIDDPEARDKFCDSLALLNRALKREVISIRNADIIQALLVRVEFYNQQPNLTNALEGELFQIQLYLNRQAVLLKNPISNAFLDKLVILISYSQKFDAVDDSIRKPVKKILKQAIDNSQLSGYTNQEATLNQLQSFAASKLAESEGLGDVDKEFLAYLCSANANEADAQAAIRNISTTHISTHLEGFLEGSQFAAFELDNEYDREQYIRALMANLVNHASALTKKMSERLDHQAVASTLSNVFYIVESLKRIEAANRVDPDALTDLTIQAFRIAADPFLPATQKADELSKLQAIVLQKSAHKQPVSVTSSSMFTHPQTQVSGENQFRPDSPRGVKK